MKRLVILWVLFTISCSEDITSEELNYLNGYWEIEEVELPNGIKKEYPMNTVVDYIEIEDSTGFRKKMVPRFDGNFETSDDAETFKILKEEDNYSLTYKNPLSERKETLVSLSKNRFSVKNPEGIIYRFKRFEPIKVEL